MFGTDPFGGRRGARARKTPRPTPYTLQPTPCALRFAPYTLHPTPYAPHPTPCNLHTPPFTLNLIGGGRHLIGEQLLLSRGAGERERERRERDTRLRALRPTRSHTLGYIGGGDEVGSSQGPSSGRGLLEPGRRWQALDRRAAPPLPGPSPRRSATALARAPVFLTSSHISQT